MSKSAFRKFRCLAAALVLSLLLPLSAFAYTTDTYNVDVNVNTDNSYNIKETIKVDFDKNKHGIYRYIPLNGANGKTALDIDYVYVEDWMYEYYNQDDNCVIQIGDPDIVVKGPQSYEIEYTMSIYDDKDTTSDMMYIDLLPTDWETAIASTSINVTLPKDIDASKLQITASAYGQQTVNKNVSYSYNEATRTIHISGHDLPKGTGITAYCPLPEGYWYNQKSNDWTKPWSVIVLLFPALLAALLWLKFGRDRRFVETVEFHPPEGMTPAEAGYIMDDAVDKKDLISMIVYYADKGYLSMEEYEDGKFSLTKLQDIDPSQPSFSTTLFNALFKNGDTVKLDELDEDFGASFAASKELLSERFKEENSIFELGSNVSFIVSYLLFAGANWLHGKLLSIYARDDFYSLISFITVIALLVATALLYNYVNKKYTERNKGLCAVGLLLAATGVGFMAKTTYSVYSSIIFALFYVAVAVIAICSLAFMARRTEKNAQVMGKLVGFRNFIEKAELDRIKMLAEENPNYFFSILPYAYVFGLTDTWIKKFESIPINKPTWYRTRTGYDPLYDYWFFSSMTRNISRNLSENINIPSGSGDAGGCAFIGGGGFTGGGFGGGGGGSW